MRLIETQNTQFSRLQLIEDEVQNLTIQFDNVPFDEKVIIWEVGSDEERNYLYKRKILHCDEKWIYDPDIQHTMFKRKVYYPNDIQDEDKFDEIILSNKETNQRWKNL